ncbi:MAG: RluA family pseudouridine synthase [Chloroflexi bacterium]|nr:RluA family pseudouridine synthase [Chloroflexota bacterium]
MGNSPAHDGARAPELHDDAAGAGHKPAFSPPARREQRLDLTVERDGERLDRFLAERSPFPRTRIQRLIEDGAVQVNGHSAKSGLKLEVCDHVLAVLTAVAAPDLTPQPLEHPLPVAYEDADVLVIDKPADLTVHPAPGHPDRTLVNALLAYVPELRTAGGGFRPGIVHRLDKDTSGLMMVAKNPAAQEKLSLQISDRKVMKRYLALVEGKVKAERGLIDAPIGRDLEHRQRMAVTQDGDGKEAFTKFRVLRRMEHTTLIEAELVTGRTHQIRVHFAAIGHPIVGDSLYGHSSPLLGRQFLHACALGFTLPSSGEWVEFTSELPADLQAALAEVEAAEPPDPVAKL